MTAFQRWPDQDTAICPFCGAGSRRGCDMEDEIGYCPADEMGHSFELDPDRLREDREFLEDRT